MMGDGKALQMGTSHELGQNFAKAFDIQYLDNEGTQQHAWTTSWGVSTRMVGGLIMCHGDDNGLRIPPALAPVQVVVLAVRDDDAVIERCRTLAEELADAGVTEAVGLVLAPHFSGFSVGEYQRRAAEAGTERGLTMHGIDHWHLETAYLDFLTAAVRDALTELPERTTVLFTAHSLPERVLENDPYPDELAASATHVAEQLGLKSWSLGWQSAGRTPEPWRGPDILEELQRIADEGSADGVLVCAQGFTADHLEVLYDLDIEAAKVASDLGLAFGRTRSLNADEVVMNALADLVVAQVQ
jgi:ferrochelatase